MNVLTHYIGWLVGRKQAETQTTDEERAALVHYATGKRTLVEIGVWHGVTTKLLRSVMAEDGTLYAVDPYFPGRLGINFQQFIAHAEVRRVLQGVVHWIRSCGAEAVKLAQTRGLQNVDFIFIDGDHSYEGLRQDWENWSPLIASGGVVGLHDSRSTPTRDLEEAGSARFTREVAVRDERFEVIGEVESVTLLRCRTSQSETRSERNTDDS